MPTWLETLVQSGIAGTVVIFLGRAVIDRWLAKDLQEHKAQLATESQKEIQRLRSRLDREVEEHRIRFSKLHETRAEVVSEVFGKLEKLHAAFRRMTAILQPGSADIEDLREDAQRAYNEFVEYYYPHAIWLDRETCDLINEILAEFRNTFFDFTFDLDERGYPRNREAWEEARDSIQEKIPEARGLLDTRFREILGVETTEQTDPV